MPLRLQLFLYCCILLYWALKSTHLGLKHCEDNLHCHPMVHLPHLVTLVAAWHMEPGY